MLQILISLLLLIGLPGGAFVAPGQTVSTSEREAIMIKLTCAELCRGDNSLPNKEKLIKDKNQIGMILRAIEGAEKLPGIYDYAVYFNVEVQYKDGSNHRYYLNISPNEDETTGFLIDLEQSSSQGFEINKEWTAQLRTLIYK